MVQPGEPDTKQSTTALRPGLRVTTADDQEIGEIATILQRDGAIYVDVSRYGPGNDRLYIPASAVTNVVVDRVFLSVDAAGLIAQAWHELPPRSL